MSVSAQLLSTFAHPELIHHQSYINGKLYQLILDNQNDLARLMTLEQGKPFAESKGEVLYGASFIDWISDCRRYC